MDVLYLSFTLYFKGHALELAMACGGPRSRPASEVDWNEEQKQEETGLCGGGGAGKD